MSGPDIVERTYGASFRRDLDCWIIYEGNGEKELCRCAHEDVDHVLFALRSAATITALQAEVAALRERVEQLLAYGAEDSSAGDAARRLARAALERNNP